MDVIPQKYRDFSYVFPQKSLPYICEAVDIRAQIMGAPLIY
jgi:hypothetical protein